MNFVARVAPEVLLHPAVESVAHNMHSFVAAFGKDGSDPISDLCYAGIARHPDPIFSKNSQASVVVLSFLELDFSGCWHVYMASIQFFPGP